MITRTENVNGFVVPLPPTNHFGILAIGTVLSTAFSVESGCLDATIPRGVHNKLQKMS